MTTKELRKQLHLTQKQFAEEIGCASSTIFLMEASGRLPGKTIRAKIKERYGVEVTDNLPTKNKPEERKANIRIERKEAQGTTLKELRTQLHLTQKQFAEEIGCGQQLISMCEVSGRVPGKRISERIKELYGVEIVEGESLPPPQNNKIDEAKTFIRELLSEGPIDSIEAVRKAEEAGIKRGSLYKAKKLAGIRSVRNGSGWMWVGIVYTEK